MTHTHDETTDWYTPPREPVRTVLRANPPEISTGARLGITHSYGYGESRPELRPVIDDQ